MKKETTIFVTGTIVGAVVAAAVCSKVISLGTLLAAIWAVGFPLCAMVGAWFIWTRFFRKEKQC